MSTVAVKTLGIVLAVHRRAQYLEEIFAQIKELARDRQGFLVVQADRPSQEVIRELDRLVVQMPERIEIHIIGGPSMLLEQSIDWMSGRKYGFDYLASHKDCEVGMMWDDDCLFSKAALKELRGHLLFFEYDRVDVEWLHLWDSTDKYNIEFPPHLSTCAYRIYEGHVYTSDLVVHCPELIARSNNKIRLKAPLFHYGYIDKKQRKELFDSYRHAGKTDAHTLALVKKPKLRKIGHF